MLTVVLRQTAGGMPRALTVAGHAGLAARGHDPLCAAVSILADTLLLTLARDWHLAADITRREAGALAATLPVPDARQAAAAAALWRSLQHGLGLLQAQYPQHITVRMETETEEEGHGT